MSHRRESKTVDRRGHMDKAKAHGFLRHLRFSDVVECSEIDVKRKAEGTIKAYES